LEPSPVKTSGRSRLLRISSRGGFGSSRSDERLLNAARHSLTSGGYALLHASLGRRPTRRSPGLPELGGV
jgi:hypothetical protein